MTVKRVGKRTVTRGSVKLAGLGERLVLSSMTIRTSSYIMALNTPAPSPFSDTKVTKVLQYKETPAASNVEHNGKPTFSLIFVVDRPNRKVRKSWRHQAHGSRSSWAKRSEALAWECRSTHNPSSGTDSPVSTAMEVNWIQGKRWTSAPDANYSLAVHARAIVSD